MKLLHTADWHLGLSLGGLSLMREQRAWAEELVALARSEAVDAVLIAGDIFDRAVSSPEAIALYDDTLTRLAETCPVLVLAGNHDGAARLSTLGRLLRSAGVYLAGSLSEPPAPVVIGDTACYLIPYFHVDQVKRLYPAQPVRTAHDAMRALMDDIRARHDPRLRMVVGAHCFVTGARPGESDYGAQLGGAMQIGAEVFSGADYVALGHLHRAQSVTARVRYSGAPYAYAFSERGCGVTLADTATGETDAWEFHPARMLRTVRGTYAEIVGAAEQDTRREDYLRVELTDRAAGLEVLETLRALYPNLAVLLGRAAADGKEEGLTVSQLEKLGPRELLLRFCQEHGGAPPLDDQVASFLAALETAREGDGMQ